MQSKKESDLDYFEYLTAEHFLICDDELLCSNRWSNATKAHILEYLIGKIADHHHSRDAEIRTRQACALIRDVAPELGAPKLKDDEFILDCMLHLWVDNLDSSPGSYKGLEGLARRCIGKPFDDPDRNKQEYRRLANKFEKNKQNLFEKIFLSDPRHGNFVEDNLFRILEALASLGLVRKESSSTHGDAILGPPGAPVF